MCPPAPVAERGKLRVTVDPQLETLIEIELPTGDSVAVHRRRFVGEVGPHVALVAGVRGDTPEGTRVLYSVGRHLQTVADRITGTIDLYPCVNPLAAHLGARNWPGLDVDLNRRFPGREEGHAPDRVVAALLAAVRGADQVIELRGAHPAFRQAPHARVSAGCPVSVERAMQANVRALWRVEGPPNPGTFEEALPSLIGLEGGAGNRLTEGVGLELGDGVLNLLAVMGLIPESDLPFHWAAIQRPIVVGDARVVDVRTGRGGLFLPTVGLWAEVAAGDVLGEVIEPVSGALREEVRAAVAGRVLAQREEPVVYPGNLVARLVATEEEA